MPCYDGGTSHEDMLAEERRRRDNIKSLYVKRLESMLCSACRTLERGGFDFDENPMLSEWWAAHKAEDEERQRKEREVANRKAYRQGIIEVALKKPVSELTAEEKKLLKEEKFL